MLQLVAAKFLSQEVAMHVTAPELFTRKNTYRQTIHDAYIIANKGICSALIAIDLDVTERFIVTRQRKLGIRKLTGNAPRKGGVHGVTL